MERVMLLITSYFCMGTELRFLKQMLVEGFEESTDSEFWHGKALELAISFLPGDAPLVKHIVSSYQKHHSPSFEQIPEDRSVTSEVRIIRPSEGIMYNKVAPCIRDIPKPSVRLAPLDLPLNDYSDSKKDRESDVKSTLNISDCLNTSKNIPKKEESPESLIKKQVPELQKPILENPKPNQTPLEISKESMKIVVEETLHPKPLPENPQKPQPKDLSLFKPSIPSAHPKTIDPKEIPKSAKSSTIRSISPSSNTLKSRAGTILRTRTEETSLNSLHSGATRGRPNKSTSNERSKSKKKKGSKDRNSQRPKTSKSHRKDKNTPSVRSKFDVFAENRKMEEMASHIGKNLNSLLSNNNSGLTSAFPSGFFDRPSSVIEDPKKVRSFKTIEKREKNKIKGTKSTRGGTPAPAIQNRQKQANTVLGIRPSGSEFIERSASNECIRNVLHPIPNLQTKPRKSSAKYRKGGNKFNMNVNSKGNSSQISKS